MATIRRPGAASAAVLIGLSVSMTGAHLLAPGWSRSVGLDVWNFGAVEADHRAATQERAAMDAKAEQFDRRRTVADQFAARLITRDADLATVAVELFDLFGNDVGSRATLESHNPGVRDPRLLYARHSLTRVECLLGGDPQRETVLARLKADCRALEAAWGSGP